MTADDAPAALEVGDHSVRRSWQARRLLRMAPGLEGAPGVGVAPRSGR